MGATAERIPTDLTLEIGDDPPPDRFLRAVQAFFGYVTELSYAATSVKRERPQWVVRVREGSDLIALEPAPELSASHEYVYTNAARGVQDLLSNGLDASGLSMSAVGHLNTLSELASGPREKASIIQLWIQRRPLQIDARIAGIVREEERLGYQDHGTVEGILDTVQDRNGSLQLRIRDPALGQPVICYVSDERLAEAFEKFRKRVEVSGVIRYRKDGTAVSIRAEKIEKLPDDDDLPGWDDVRGILRVVQ